jgi:hypothetical protein
LNSIKIKIADTGIAIKKKVTQFNIKAMKAMKISVIALCFILIAEKVSAQEYKITVQNPKNTRVILKNFNGQLPIEGYGGNDIVITSTYGRYEPPEKAKGLKPIFPGGADNTGIGLDVEKTDKIITITCLIPFTQEGEYKIRMPESATIEVSSDCERANHVSIKGMKNELDIETCYDIELKDVTGPLVLASNGNIDVTFSTINTTKPSSVQSVTGDIDITMPVNTPVSLELSTGSGAFYSDFDFTDIKKDLKIIGGNELRYDLNGGGFKFNIGSISGNIFLRKGD